MIGILKDETDDARQCGHAGGACIQPVDENITLFGLEQPIEMLNEGCFA